MMTGRHKTELLEITEFGHVFRSRYDAVVVPHWMANNPQTVVDQRIKWKQDKEVEAIAVVATTGEDGKDNINGPKLRRPN